MQSAELERARGSAPLRRRGGSIPWEGTGLRALQRMGPVSLGVSLPRTWIEAHQLRVGASVQLRVTPDGSLRIAPDKPASGSGAGRCQIEVTPGTPPEHLFRRLLGAYLAGATEFEVRQGGGLSSETRAVVRMFVRRTIQPEVLSEEADRIELQDASDASPVPLMRLLSRMGQMVLALQREAGESWGSLASVDGSFWEARDDEVDRQAWFIERSAVRRLDRAAVGTPAEEARIGALGCWNVARSLERIADHAVQMGETGFRLAEGAVPPTHLAALQQFHAHALHLLETVLEELPKESGARSNELLDTGAALHETARTLSERLFPSTRDPPSLPPSSAMALGRILESIDRTVAYTQDIAQVSLDRDLPFSGPLPIDRSSERVGSTSRASIGDNAEGGTRRK